MRSKAIVEKHYHSPEGYSYILVSVMCHGAGYVFHENVPRSGSYFVVLISDSLPQGAFFF